MKKGLTELVFIMDRSGSMSGMEEDTIGGFNSMLKKQKEVDGTAYVTTVLFSSDVETLHDRVEIDKVEPITSKDYTVSGCTALIDAIGGTIDRISKVQKIAGKEYAPESTLFVITTDGMENASITYTAEEVKKKIRDCEKEFGWEFVFIAANIDAVETAEKIGIRKERAANYNYTKKGTRKVYDSINKVASCMRKSKSIDQNCDWIEELNKN